MTFEMHKVVSLKRRYQSQFKQETHVPKSVIVTNANILENKSLHPNPNSWGVTFIPSRYTINLWIITSVDDITMTNIHVL